MWDERGERAAVREIDINARNVNILFVYFYLAASKTDIFNQNYNGFPFIFCTCCQIVRTTFLTSLQESHMICSFKSFWMDRNSIKVISFIIFSSWDNDHIITTVSYIITFVLEFRFLLSRSSDSISPPWLCNVIENQTNMLQTKMRIM